MSTLESPMNLKTSEAYAIRVAEANIDDVIMRIAADDPIIESVNLSAVHLTDKKFQEFLDALKFNSVVRMLNLSHCDLSGASVKKLSEFLESNCKVTWVDVSFNQLGRHPKETYHRFSLRELHPSSASTLRQSPSMPDALQTSCQRRP